MIFDCLSDWAAVVHEIVFMTGVLGLFLAFFSKKNRNNQELFLLYLIVFMLGWRVLFSFRMQSRRYSEILILLFAVFSSKACIELPVLLKSAFGKQDGRKTLLLSFALLFSVILFEFHKTCIVDTYKKDIVAMYERCKRINQDKDKVSVFTNTSKEKNRIAYYIAQGQNDVPYQITNDNMEDMFVLLPDIMFRKSVFLIFEENSSKESGEKLLKRFNDIAECHQIASIYTSEKKNKSFMFFELKSNPSSFPNPQFVRGKKSVTFQLADLYARNGTRLLQDEHVIVKGQNSLVSSVAFFPVPVSNNIIQSVAVKNVGSNTTRLYIGYIYYKTAFLERRTVFVSLQSGPAA